MKIDELIEELKDPDFSKDAWKAELKINENTSFYITRNEANLVKRILEEAKKDENR